MEIRKQKLHLQMMIKMKLNNIKEMAKNTQKYLGRYVYKTHHVLGKDSQEGTRSRQTLKKCLNFKDKRLFATHPSEITVNLEIIK